MRYSVYYELYYDTRSHVKVATHVTASLTSLHDQFFLYKNAQNPFATTRYKYA
jgi:hypothetical protein